MIYPGPLKLEQRLKTQKNYCRFNLINGAELIPTLLQICYATAIGYLFVIIFRKSKSIVPCIIAHSVNNALSIFNADNTVSLYVAPVFLIIVPLLYAVYINKAVKE